MMLAEKDCVEKVLGQKAWRSQPWIVGLALWLMVSARISADDAKVAAAASLNYVLPDIAKVFQEKTGQSVKLIFGSSRSLARQIVAGAPFDLFLSADKDSIRLLEDRFLTQGEAVIYGLGRLALYASRQLKFPLSSDLKHFGVLLTGASVQRLAIANPETAPYGRAAREALENTGNWQLVRPRLVIGGNALQTAQFAISGSVEIALIPYSIALIPLFERQGRTVLVSDNLYYPLEHEMVLLNIAGNSARAFFQFLQMKKARSIFAAYGLGIPDPLNPSTPP